LKTFIKPIVILLTASLILVGCSRGVSSAQNSENQTAVAGTLAAMQTQISIIASQPAAPVVIVNAAPTATKVPTAMPSATAQTTETTAAANFTKNSSGPSLRVGEVQDLNFPDSTSIDVNLDFIKIWSIKNVGTATWPADTKVVPTDDNPLHAGAYTIGQVVSPRQTVEIKLPLKAPETAQTYKAKFMLETSNGTRFGIGANFDQPFWVEIIAH
jgi:hypothetical protein